VRGIGSSTPLGFVLFCAGADTVVVCCLARYFVAYFVIIGGLVVYNSKTVLSSVFHPPSSPEHLPLGDDDDAIGDPDHDTKLLLEAGKRRAHMDAHSHTAPAVGFV